MRKRKYRLFKSLLPILPGEKLRFKAIHLPNEGLRVCRVERIQTCLAPWSVPFRTQETRVRFSGWPTCTTDMARRVRPETTHRLETSRQGAGWPFQKEAVLLPTSLTLP